MSATTSLSLEEFLKLPQSEGRYELVDGEVVPKVSPQTPHSRCCKRLLKIVDAWCEQSEIGEINPEWGVALRRRGRDWVPVPNLTYICYSCLPPDWNGDGFCPVPAQLVIEIISPGQTFGSLAEKAADYLAAGVERVWIVDLQEATLTVFYQDQAPRTFRGPDVVEDSLLPGLTFTVTQILP